MVKTFATFGTYPCFLESSQSRLQFANLEKFTVFYEKIYCRAGHLSKLRTATVLNSGFTERPGCTINTFSCVAGRTLESGTGGRGGVRGDRDQNLPPQLQRGFSISIPATKGIYSCHPRYQGDLQLPPQLPHNCHTIATPATKGIYSCHPLKNIEYTYS